MVIKLYTIQFLDDATGNGGYRQMARVPALNDGETVDIGKNVTLVTQDPQITPEFGQNLSLASGSVFVQTSSSHTNLRAVEITAISNPATSGARATCQEVNSSGFVTSQGTVFNDVVPQPFPHMAAVGMKGVYFSQSVPSGLSSTRVSTGFVYLPLSPFGNFE